MHTSSHVRHRPRYPRLKRPELGTGLVAEVAIPDHHMGRESWESAEEAKAVFLEAIAHLVRPYKRGEFDRIIFPVGNDYINWDSWNQTTTAGTPQPGGESPDTVIGVGFDTLVEGVDALSMIADVDVVVVPGNHDWLLSHMLGVALEAWYRNAPHVSVDKDLESWKFRSGDGWLLALTHGKEPASNRALKPEQLAGALPIKAPQLWASSSYREVQTGHLHHKSKGYVPWVQDENSVTVRRLPSLARKNTHEKANLYQDTREAQLFVLGEQGPFEFRSYRP